MQPLTLQGGRLFAAGRFLGREKEDAEVVHSLPLVGADGNEADGSLEQHVTIGAWTARNRFAL